MAPRSLYHHINLHHFIIALLLLCFYFFTLHFYTKNAKNIIYHLYQISLSHVTLKGLKTPKRVGCVELLFLCRYEGLARSLLLD